MYLAGDGETALVEAFQETAVVNRVRDDPWLVVIALRRQVRLLDLRGSWATRAGASMALAAADEPIATQTWARAIYAQYDDISGIVYPSAMRGHPAGAAPSGVDPGLFCANAALFERARPSIPVRPRIHLPLAHPGLAPVLGSVAAAYGYDLI